MESEDHKGIFRYTYRHESHVLHIHIYRLRGKSGERECPNISIIYAI